MPSRTAPSASPLLIMKDRAKGAFVAACEADASRLATYERLLSETMTSASGQPAAVSMAMWQQTAAVFELLAFRRGWPGNLRGR